MLGGVASRTFFVNNDGSSESVLESVGSASFLDVPDFLVVQIVEHAVAEVAFVVPEKFEPIFKVGDHFPTALPTLQTDSSPVVAILQHHIQFITGWVVFRKDGGLSIFTGLVELSLKRRCIVLFFENPVCEIIGSFWIKLLDELLKVEDALSSEELVQWHLGGEEVSIMGLLLLAKSLAFGGHFWHLMSVHSGVLQFPPQLFLQLPIKTSFLVGCHISDVLFFVHGLLPFGVLLLPCSEGLNELHYRLFLAIVLNDCASLFLVNASSQVIEHTGNEPFLDLHFGAVETGGCGQGFCLFAFFPFLKLSEFGIQFGDVVEEGFDGFVEASFFVVGIEVLL